MGGSRSCRFSRGRIIAEAKEKVSASGKAKARFMSCFRLGCLLFSFKCCLLASLLAQPCYWPRPGPTGDAALQSKDLAGYLSEGCAGSCQAGRSRSWPVSCSSSCRPSSDEAGYISEGYAGSRQAGRSRSWPVSCCSSCRPSSDEAGQRCEAGEAGGEDKGLQSPCGEGYQAYAASEEAYDCQNEIQACR